MRKTKKRLLKLLKISVVLVLVLSLVNVTGHGTNAEMTTDNTAEIINDDSSLNTQETLDDDEQDNSDDSLILENGEEELLTPEESTDEMPVVENNDEDTTTAVSENKTRGSPDTPTTFALQRAVTQNNNETIFDHGGNYSINYILNNFNIFTKEDAIAGHTIGAVAVGGKASFQNGIGRNGYNHTTPSYFGGGFTSTVGWGTGFNSYLGNNIIYLADRYTAIPDWAYQSYDIRINSNTNPDNQYINFDRAFTSISNEVARYASDSNRIIVNPNEESELYSFSGGTVSIKVGYIYEFASFDNIDIINVLTESEEDKYGDAIILCNQTGTLKTPQVVLNGKAEIPGQSADKEVGEGCGIVFMLPHATVVDDSKAGQRHIGHIVAPNAEIRNVNGDSNGCFIAKSVNIPGTESHMWPYNGKTVTPISTTLEAKKLVDNKTPNAKFEFEASLISQPDGSTLVYKNKTATNNGTNISFPKINDIQVEGDYFFEIKEVIPDNQNGYIYDDAVFYAKVTIVKAGTKFVVDSITYGENYINGQLSETVKIPTFNNTTGTANEIDIPVKKMWEDGNDAEGFRPTSITVELYKNGKATGKTITLNEGNNWEGKFNKLPISENDTTIEYTVKEVNLSDKYTAVITGNVNHGFVITNTHEVEKTSIPVQKIWSDFNDQDGLRPVSINVKLLENGQEVSKLTLNESNEWKGAFVNLPVYKNGKKITYTIQEITKIDGYTTTISGDSINGYIIINTHIPEETSIPVEKVWVDNNNQDGMRPDSIVVKLLADGVDTGTRLTLNANNKWKGSFNNLDIFKNGIRIFYSVEEVKVEGYETVITGSSPVGYTITNTHEIEKVEKEVNKIWNDNSNQDGLRPAEVKVQLYANATAIGEPVVLTEAKGWTYRWDNLDKYLNGTEIVYTVREVSTNDHYSPTYSKDTFTITNNHITLKTDKTVFKVWDDEDNQDGIRPEDIQVQLYADGKELGAPVTLNLANRWSYTWENLEKNAAGKEIVYTVKEVKVPEGYEVSYNQNMLIIKNTHEIEETEVSVIKKWEDNNNQDGKRPTEIKAQLFANATVKGEAVTLSEENNWTYTWENLPKNLEGKEITYTVRELDVADHYNVHYSNVGNVVTITNSYETEDTSRTVYKVWDDEDNQDGLRPASIQVQLYADGKESGAPVTLNLANRWAYTWNNLDKYANGKEIVYTVEELNVPEGYEMTQNGFEITNTHKTEETEVTVNKVWDDEDNQDGRRPDIVEVQLYENATEKGDIVKLTEENNWTYTWKNLPKNLNGKEITYTVREIGVLDTGDLMKAINGYDVHYSNVGNVVTITNSYKTEDTSRTVYKVWDDEDNQDGLRPASIQVQLYADGKELGEPVTLELANRWAYTWDNLDKYADGKEIVYTVKELNVPEGYEMTQNGFEITNTHKTEETEVTVNKVWNDEDNQDGRRPTEIKAQLYENATVKGEAVTLSEENNWTYTWKNLPKNLEGKEITYTVRELDVADHYNVQYSNVGNDITITNSYETEDTSRTVYKVWDDKDNQDGIRPESIQVQLYADGKELGDSVTLELANRWAYTWNNLDKYDDGKEIDYTVKEIGNVEGYTVTIKGFEITNTHKTEETEVTVNKVWDDEDDQDGRRPTSIKVQLYENATVKGEVVTLSEENNWTYTWENLPKNHNGEEITYTVRELDVDKNYNVHYSNVGNDITITNTYEVEKTEKTVIKVWDDKDNQDGIRPASIQVQLYANDEALGEPVTLELANRWSYNWTNLDKYADGELITYTVKEVNIPEGYEVSYNQESLIITNTHETEETDVSVTKKWEDNNDQDGKRPTEIEVQLYENATAKGNPVTLSEDNNWQHTWENLPKYHEGEEITYTVRELDLDKNYNVHYSNVGNDITITNRYETEDTSRTVYKVWKDSNNQDGLRPTSIQVQLYADGKALGEPVTLELANRWAYTWDNLDKYDDGKEIVYTVKEIGTYEGYTTTINGFVITNTHETETVEKTVTKVWDDKDNQDGVRPASIHVQLYENATAIGEPIELSAANSWTYTWKDLPKNHNGVEIVYTVRELDVADHYFVNYSKDTFTITNKYETLKTDKTVFKVWDDNEDQDGIRPEEIKVQLYANDKATGEPVTLNLENKWSYTWENLELKEKGVDIVYTVKEIETPEGYEVSYSDDTFIITNKHETETVEKTVNKVWNDNNNQDGIRPNEIQVQLYADGIAYGEAVTLTKDSGWTYTWEALPKNNNGVEVVYTVAEVTVLDGYTPTYEAGNDVYVITNTHKPVSFNIPVYKVWDDSDNLYGTRPESIIVHLHADGELVATGTLSEETNWTYTFENLPKFKDGKQIVYSFEEVSVSGYYTTVDRNVITNSMYGTLTIEKIFAGDTVEIPEELTFTVTGPNGYVKTIAYSEFVNNQFVITGLEFGEYVVSENGAEVKDYKLEVTGEGIANITDENKHLTVTLVNTYTKETEISLVIYKADQDRKLLEGATFKLVEVVDGEEKDVQTISGGPEYEFEELTDGIYRIYETEAPEGYEGLDTYFEIEVIDGEIYFEGELTHTFTVINTNDGTEPDVLGDEDEFDDDEEFEDDVEGEEVVDTSDNQKVIEYIALAIFALFGICLLSKKRRIS